MSLLLPVPETQTFAHACAPPVPGMTVEPTAPPATDGPWARARFGRAAV